MISFNLLATAIVSFYASSASAEDYATYPSVAHTATINGFADPIYGRNSLNVLSRVSKKTLIAHHVHTGIQAVFVLCQTGVLQLLNVLLKIVRVVMFQLLTSLATSICSSAGVPSPYWYIQASDATALQSAAEATVTSQN